MATFVTVRGGYSGLNRQPATGYVEVQPSAPLQDSATDLIYEGVVTLPILNNAISVDLVATDSATISPTGITYLFTEHVNGGPPCSYSITVLEADAASGIDLADVAPAVPQDPTFSYALVSVTNDLNTRVSALEAGDGSGGGGVAGVASFNGRAGAVTPQAGDYPPALIGAATQADLTSTSNALQSEISRATDAESTNTAAIASEAARAQAAEAAIRAGLRYQQARAAATSNINTLSGIPSSGASDGITLTDGDVILLVAQSAGSKNGRWIVHTGAWVRPADYAAGSDASGVAVYVEDGTTQKSSLWVVAGSTNNIVDTNVVTYQQASGLGEVTAGTGLTKNGNTLNVDETVIATVASVTAETTRAEAAEAANATAIGNETTRAEAAESSNAAAVANETTRAEAAEAANTAAVNGKAPKLTPTATKTGDYTLGAGDFARFDCTNNRTGTLPNAPADGTRVGARVDVLGVGKSLTLTAAGSDTFQGGGTTLALSMLGESVQLTYRAAETLWVITEHGYAKAALSSAYAPLAGPFAPSSTGASAATRYVGGTVSGPPTTGTFAVGDYIVDQAAKIYVCVTAGTPGVWRRAGSGFLLASSSWTSATDPAFTVDGSMHDVDASALRMTVPANVPWVCEIEAGFIYTQGTTTAATSCQAQAQVVDSATGLVVYGYAFDKRQFASASGSGQNMFGVLHASDEQPALGSDTAVKLQGLMGPSTLTSAKFSTFSAKKPILIRAVAR